LVIYLCRIECLQHRRDVECSQCGRDESLSFTDVLLNVHSVVVMGHCQSACCPPSDRRSKPNISYGVGLPLSANAAPSSSETTGSVSSGGNRYHIESQDKGDYSKDSGENVSDAVCGSNITRGPLDGKLCFTDISRQHSERQSNDRKRALQGSNSAESALDSRINRLYEHYSDNAEGEDCIAVAGIERLCADLNVEPEDFRVLLFAWQCGAHTMCRLTRAEFVTGCKRLRADSTSSISSRLPGIIEDIRSDKSKFRDLYRWSYGFALDAASLQRTLSLDMAVAMWRLVFSGMNSLPAVLPHWFEYLEKRNSDVRIIPRDTWDMFLVFVETIGDDLGSYDDCEAWPTLLDDFVEYENDRQNQNLLMDLPDKECQI